MCSMWFSVQVDGLTLEVMPSVTGWFRLAGFWKGLASWLSVTGLTSGMPVLAVTL